MSKHAAKSQLPFTGLALTVYLVIGVGLVLAGIALRIFGAAGTD